LINKNLFMMNTLLALLNYLYYLLVKQAYYFLY